MSRARSHHAAIPFPIGGVSGRQRRQWLLGLACLAILSGCGEEASQGDAPAQQAATQSGGDAGGGAYRVDMDAIFPQGAGRDLVLNNCQN